MILRENVYAKSFDRDVHAPMSSALGSVDVSESSTAKDLSGFIEDFICEIDVGEAIEKLGELFFVYGKL